MIYLLIKEKIKGQLSLQHIFAFCRTFKKLTEHVGFHLKFKSSDLQDIFYTSLGDNIKVNFDKLIFYVPIFIRGAQTQVMFNDSIKNKFRL